jgi:hypothetical protein
VDFVYCLKPIRIDLLSYCHYLYRERLGQKSGHHRRLLITWLIRTTTEQVEFEYVPIRKKKLYRHQQLPNHQKKLVALYEPQWSIIVSFFG